MVLECFRKGTTLGFQLKTMVFECFCKGTTLWISVKNNYFDTGSYSLVRFRCPCPPGARSRVPRAPDVSTSRPLPGVCSNSRAIVPAPMPARPGGTRLIARGDGGWAAARGPVRRSATAFSRAAWPQLEKSIFKINQYLATAPRTSPKMLKNQYLKKSIFKDLRVNKTAKTCFKTCFSVLFTE